MYEDILKDVDQIAKGKAFLTVDEVAELLNCEPKVIYNWNRRYDKTRRPPRMTIGKTIRFPKAAFIHWLIKENGLGE